MFITHSDDNIAIRINSVQIIVEVPRKAAGPMRMGSYR